eukprot:13415064-Heterocapsa_arctica.AAC.1
MKVGPTTATSLAQMQIDGKFDAVSAENIATNDTQLMMMDGLEDEKIDANQLKHEYMFAKRPIMMYGLNKHLINMYGLKYEKIAKNDKHLMMHCL